MNKLEYRAIKEEDVWPICPHCEKEIREIGFFEQSGIMHNKVARAFVCPHCHKVIGTGMVGW